MVRVLDKAGVGEGKLLKKEFDEKLDIPDADMKRILETGREWLKAREKDGKQ